MSREKRHGVNNPNSTVRARTNGSTVNFARRNVSPSTRKYVDSLFIPNKTDVAQNASQESRHVPKRAASNRTGQNLKPARPRQSRSEVLARNTFRPKPKRGIKSRNRSHIATSRLLVVFSGIFFLSISLLGYYSWKFNRQTNDEIKVLSSSVENDTKKAVSEDEVTPEDLSTYKVASDMPRYLKVQSLGIDARIIVLGDPPSGILSSPSNIFDAGWYNYSARPGQPGAVLINGYVNGPSKDGVFYQLGNIIAGDSIDIVRGDGEILTYNVISMEQVDQDKIDMTKLTTSVDPNKPGLNLITHTDRYDIMTNKYEQRTIVYAVQQ
jgi:sortase (surface protein transpeptidase)